MTKLSSTQRIKRKLPLQVYAVPDRSWVWMVYRHYQQPKNEAKNPYARVLCDVVSPFMPNGSGARDTYLSSIRSGGGVKVFDEARDGQVFNLETFLKG